MLTTFADPVTPLILDQQPTLKRLARRLTRCESDAEDLVQEALIRAFRARRRFRPGTSIAAWTNTILRRVFLSGVAAEKRHGVRTDTDSGDVLESVPETTSVVDERSIDLARLEERLDDPVKKALERVPPIYREPFLLAVVMDLSCAEIARRLGVPEGTVMSRVHRARERMKQDLVYAA